jgi:hypothetical protein
MEYTSGAVPPESTELVGNHQDITIANEAPPEAQRVDHRPRPTHTQGAAPGVATQVAANAATRHLRDTSSRKAS